MSKTSKKRNLRRHRGIAKAVISHLGRKVADHIQIETEKVHRKNQVTGPHLHRINQSIRINQKIRINHRAIIGAKENRHHHHHLRHQNIGHRHIRLRARKKSE